MGNSLKTTVNYKLKLMWRWDPSIRMYPIMAILLNSDTFHVINQEHSSICHKLHSSKQAPVRKACLPPNPKPKEKKSSRILNSSIASKSSLVIKWNWAQIRPVHKYMSSLKGTSAKLRRATFEASTKGRKRLMTCLNFYDSLTLLLHAFSVLGEIIIISYLWLGLPRKNISSSRKVSTEEPKTACG